MVFEEILNAVESLGNLVDGCGVGTADVPFTALPEGIARDKRDMLGLKQFLREFVRCVTGRDDAGEDVEGAFWLKAF